VCLESRPVRQPRTCTPRRAQSVGMPNPASVL
jgi:hypothetical protein